MMSESANLSSFIVKFDQLAEIKFRNCGGMQFHIQPIYYPDSTQSSGYHTGRGSVGTSELSFAYGTVDGTHSGGGQSLSDWLLKTTQLGEALDKRNGRISLQSSEGKTLAQWKILKAWPCRWEGPTLGMENAGLSIDTITFAHEGLERLK